MERKRPLVVPVLGVLNVLAGIALFVGTTFLVIGFSLLGEWMALLLIYALIKSAVLLLSGVGLLLSKRWGRVLVLVFGWWMLLEVVAGFLLGGWAIFDSVAQEGGVKSVIANVALQVLLRTLFPSIQLVVAYLPSVRRYFRVDATDVAADPKATE